MQDIVISETVSTPGITFDSKELVWSITGRSFHSAASKVFAPLFAWLHEIEGTPVAHCTVNFRLEFLNTPTSKIIFELLRRLGQIFGRGNGRVQINWYYEEDDEDIRETGEALLMSAGLPFELLSS